MVIKSKIRSALWAALGASAFACGSALAIAGLVSVGTTYARATEIAPPQTFPMPNVYTSEEYTVLNIARGHPGTSKATDSDRRIARIMVCQVLRETQLGLKSHRQMSRRDDPMAGLEDLTKNLEANGFAGEALVRTVDACVAFIAGRQYQQTIEHSV